MEIIHDKETNKVTVTFGSPKEAYDAFTPIEYDMDSPGSEEIRRVMEDIRQQAELNDLKASLAELNDLKASLAEFLNVSAYGLEVIYRNAICVIVKYGSDCEFKVYRNKLGAPQNYLTTEIKATDIMTMEQIVKTIELMTDFVNR